jgi:hypothetical protein
MRRISSRMVPFEKITSAAATLPCKPGCVAGEVVLVESNPLPGGSLRESLAGGSAC